MKFVGMVVLILSQLMAAQDLGKGVRTMETLTGVYRAEANGPATAPGMAEDGFSYLVFFRDGIVLRDRPSEGLQGWDDNFWMQLDFRSGVAPRVQRWGAYLLANGQRQIIFADRQIWNIDITGYPQRLEIQGRNYVLLEPGNGLTLQGTYKSMKDDSFITFTPDGRMNQQGLVANCISGGQHFSYNNGMPSAHSAGNLCLDRRLAGGHSVGYYTLQLSFSNSSQTFAFWVDPSATKTSPQAVCINGVRYELIHK